MLNFFFLKYLTYTITSFMNQWGKKIQQYISINKVTYTFSKKKKKTAKDPIWKKVLENNKATGIMFLQ